MCVRYAAITRRPPTFHRTFSEKNLVLDSDKYGTKPSYNHHFSLLNIFICTQSYHNYCYKLLTEGVCPVLKVTAKPNGRALGGCYCELSCGRESVILKISAMVWGDSENHVAVIALHKMDKLTSKIVTTPMQLKISKMFVYRTFKRFMETGPVVDHPQQGRPCSIRTKRLVQTVAACIH